MELTMFLVFLGLLLAFSIIGYLLQRNQKQNRRLLNLVKHSMKRKRRISQDSSSDCSSGVWPRIWGSKLRKWEHRRVRTRGSSRETVGNADCFSNLKLFSKKEREGGPVRLHSILLNKDERVLVKKELKKKDDEDDKVEEAWEAEWRRQRMERKRRKGARRKARLKTIRDANRRLLRRSIVFQSRPKSVTFNLEGTQTILIPVNKKMRPYPKRRKRSKRYQEFGNKARNGDCLK